MNGPLNERELRVVAAVAEGLTNAEIGQRIGVTEEVVKYTLVKIAGNTSIRSRAAIVNWAWQNGYLRGDTDTAGIEAENEKLRNQVANLETMLKVAVTHPGDVHRAVLVDALTKAEKELAKVRRALNGDHEDWAETIAEACRL